MNSHLPCQPPIAVAVKSRKHCAGVLPAHFRALYRAAAVQIIEQVQELA